MATFLPSDAELPTLDTLEKVRVWAGMKNPVYVALLHQFGMHDPALGPSDQVAGSRFIAIIEAGMFSRMTAAMQIEVVQPAPVGGAVPAGVVYRPATPLEWQQALLVWRACQKLFGLPDADPYGVQLEQDREAKMLAAGFNPTPAGPALISPPGTSFSGGVTTGTAIQLVQGPGGVPTLPQANLASGVTYGGMLIKRLKMKEFIDQSDETEIPVGDLVTVTRWLQVWVTQFKRPRKPACAANANQLTALFFRVNNGGSLYANLALFVPFQTAVGNWMKFQVFLPVGQGAYEQRMIKAPHNFHLWTLSWEVFKHAAVCIGAAEAGTLDAYYEVIKGFVTRWAKDLEHLWGLISIIEDQARREFAVHVKALLEVGRSKGEEWAKDYDASRP